MKRVLIIVYITLINNPIKTQTATNLFAKANAEFLLGNYMEAIQNCDKALKKNINLKETNFVAGLACLNLNDTIQAIKYFSEEIKINKKDYRPFLYRARLNIKNYDQSNKDLLVAIKL